MGRPAVMLTGRKCDMLQVLSRVNANDHGRALWLCRCACGAEVVKSSAYLTRTGSRKSCGCVRHVPEMSKVPSRVGKLTILNYVKATPTSGAGWLCQCDCGRRRIVMTKYLTNKSAKCCLDVSCQKAMMSLRKRTHGESQTPLYRRYRSMVDRCHRPTTSKYHNYGGRGVVVCERWRKSYESFKLDVGLPPSDEHQLDRYPNQNGNYEPGNVRWATTLEQTRNKRTNRIVTYRGMTRIASDWAEEFGIPVGTFIHWLKRYEGDVSQIEARAKNHKPRNTRVIYQDKDLTLKEWALSLNVPPNTLYRWYTDSKGDMSLVCAWANSRGLAFGK